MVTPYRFAVCNELFQKLPFEQACREIRRIGYDGIEIAPFTLAENATTLSPDDRGRIRQTILDHGLKFVGLHWLLVSPQGMHAATKDKDVRNRTWNFIRGLIDLCADLSGSHDGQGGVMVLGSPQQRSAMEGTKPSEATQILKEELANAAPQAESRGVQLLLEPLSPSQTNVVTSLAEAVSIVKEIGSPAVATMFDVHNAIDEARPHADLLKEYTPYIRHVHVNEIDGREPGTGNYDFRTLLAALNELDYRGWVSLEAFDFTKDPVETASGALKHLTDALTS